MWGYEVEVVQFLSSSMVEQPAVNRGVRGSRPRLGANKALGSSAVEIILAGRTNCCKTSDALQYGSLSQENGRDEKVPWRGMQNMQIQR